MISGIVIPKNLSITSLEFDKATRAELTSIRSAQFNSYSTLLQTLLLVRMMYESVDPMPLLQGLNNPAKAWSLVNVATKFYKRYDPDLNPETQGKTQKNIEEMTSLFDISDDEMLRLEEKIRAALAAHPDDFPRSFEDNLHETTERMAKSIPFNAHSVNMRHVMENAKLALRQCSPLAAFEEQSKLFCAACAARANIEGEKSSGNIRL